MLNKKVFRLLLLLIFFVLLLTGYLQSKGKFQINIELLDGTIRLINGRDYEVRYKGQNVVLKNVRSLIIFEGEPYFELADWKILKWTEVLKENSYNLQKVWDKLYFITDVGEVEIEKYYLTEVDKSGKMTTIELSYYDNQLVSAQDYCILRERLIAGSFYELCITDETKKKFIKCYDLKNLAVQ